HSGTRRSARRARPRRAKSFAERLQHLRERADSLTDVRRARAQLLNLLRGRALDELRVPKLRLNLPQLLLQLLSLALDARTLLLEVNQTFERHCDLRPAREHCTRQRARNRLAAESHAGSNILRDP